MNDDIKDLRGGERFLLVNPLPGSFGGAAVRVRDVADQGAQVEHSDPLRIGLRARFSFRTPDGVVAAPGLVIWSRLSQTPNDEGKLLYRSGIRIIEDTDLYVQSLKSLSTGGFLRRDPDSLERRKQRLAARENQKTHRPMMKIVHSSQNVDVSPDQELLIRHAREWLREHAEEALKWYNRAKYASVDDTAEMPENAPHREDVLAVWEFLERSVPLPAIMKVFESRS